MVVVPEQAVVDLWGDLEEDTREIVENSAFLIGGREQQHILTDFEIATMVKEVNYTDLLSVLLVVLCVVSEVLERKRQRGKSHDGGTRNKRAYRVPAQ